MRIRKLLLGAVTAAIALNPYFAYADEIVVSGNGEGSTNNVNISSTQNTQTEQTNTAEVNNNVEISANTGDNTASENSGGDTSITTGDVNVSSEIGNENINESFVETGCCNDALTLNISGNGAYSDNSIDYSTSSNTNVSIENTANIQNYVSGYANTGGNSANQNSGSVSIQTGDIYAQDSIKNSFINAYGVEASSGNGGSVYISIDGNGADSDNSINFSNDSNVDIDINNSANVINESDWDLNTGDNEANGNLGDVNITTGDIVFNSTIENGPINYGWVDVDCCEEEEEDGGGNPPDGTPPPTTETQPSSSSSSSSPGSSSSGGTSVSQGQVLPVTGGAPSLLFLLIGNVVMFFLGGYLRLRSGRAPNLLISK